MNNIELNEKLNENQKKPSDYLLRACDLCQEINSKITLKKYQYAPCAFDFLSKRSQRKLIERYFD